MLADSLSKDGSVQIKQFFHPLIHKTAHTISCSIMSSSDSIDKTAKSRNRVSIACTICRKKKIKCDGQIRCLHCVSANKDCIYPETTVRRTRTKEPKKVDKAQSMKILDTRLAKLESLILNLAGKLETINDGKSIAMKLESQLEAENGDSESESSTNENDMPLESGFLFKKGTSPEKPDKLPYDPGNKSFSIEKYYGIHSTFHIFSHKSIAWIKTKLTPKDAVFVTPLENLPTVFSACSKAYTNLWTEPHGTSKVLLQEGIFPDNPNLVGQLLQLFDSIFLAGFLVDAKYVEELTNIYYSNKGILLSAPKRSLRYSELLIMNVAISLCISVAINKRMYSNTESSASSASSNNSTFSCFPAINAMELDDLIKIQDELFKDAIYYYARISVISDGIRTIQAILLLIIYLETSLVVCDVNYILSSVAVRFAQEIGLHRFESFSHLPEDDRTYRRRLWWFCQYFDMEICYRIGKPPLVNDADVSTFGEKDTDLIFLKVHKDRVKPGSGNILAEIVENKLVHTYIGHYTILLTRIRSRSYKELFSATVQYNSFRSILKTLTKINSDMKKLLEGMDIRLRPRFYNDPEFKERLEAVPNYMNGANLDCAKENVYAIQLSYFLHLMTINKLPFQMASPDHDENCRDSIQFRNLSLDSSRTILNIVLTIDRHNYPLSFLNWILFFPFAAFLNLLGNCINHPNSPESMRDVSLLIDTSVSFFAHNNRYAEESNNSSSKIYHQRESLCDLSVRIMLKIMIKIMEAHLNIEILKENSFLQSHLSAVETDYPDLYNRVKKDVVSHRINGDNTPSGSMKYNAPGIDTSKWSYGTSGYVTINTGQPPNYNTYMNASPSGLTPESRRQPSLSNILQTPEFVYNDQSKYPSVPNQAGSFNLSNDQFLKDGYSLDSDPVKGYFPSKYDDLPNYFFDNGL